MRTKTLLEKLDHNEETSLENKTFAHLKKSELNKQLIEDYYNEILES